MADRAADTDERRRALDALVRGRDAKVVPVLHGLLAEEALRGEALRALADFDHAETPAAILGAYPGLTLEERRDGLNTLASRPSWCASLLAALGDERVPRTDVGAFVVRQITGHNSDELDAELQRVWGNIRNTPAEKSARMAVLKEALTAERLADADLPHGRALFAKTCQQCHTLYGVGDDVGPELTGSNRADLDYILHNMIDPSAEVGRDYQATTVWLLDGRIVTGLLRGENDTALTLSARRTTPSSSRRVRSKRLDPATCRPCRTDCSTRSPKTASVISSLTSLTPRRHRAWHCPATRASCSTERASRGGAETPPYGPSRTANIVGRSKTGILKRNNFAEEPIIGLR